MAVRLTEHPMNPAGLLEGFSRARTESGALVTFTGLARSHGGQVLALELEAYPGFTETAIEAETLRAKERFVLDDLLVVHRIGRISPGETIVFVAAAATHRRAAFEAADYVMDYLKTRAPFWKKSHEIGGARWIEPTVRDYEDQARWDAPEAAS
jgi:molybdopterin synthase catalytic subunit